MGNGRWCFARDEFCAPTSPALLVGLWQKDSPGMHQVALKGLAIGNSKSCICGMSIYLGTFYVYALILYMFALILYIHMLQEGHMRASLGAEYTE